MEAAISLSPAPLTATEVPAPHGQPRRWQLMGRLDADTADQLQRGLSRQLRKSTSPLQVDLSGVTSLDAAGAATLVDLWRLGQARGVAVQVVGAEPAVLEKLAQFQVSPSLAAEPPPVGALEALGEAAWANTLALRDFVVLAADVTVGAAAALLRPHRLRWGALAQQASLMGSQALGIVGLITFLIGLTLAFQSAYQLRQFGAAIYVATLTAISMVREMGPLITAILVAGRSGSSITSEVATMKVGEEIDALHVMGIPFVDFVAVPKLVAMLVTVPLLTVLADVLGILGGWIVGMVYLDLAPRPYLQKTMDALVAKDLATGLFKSAVFAWGIALIGLYYGAGVRGGAQEVGRATTASVVSGIFFIIVADSLFSILFYVVLG
ncbi:MAG: ABC transporter permease [Deltaproteobacteria bacterium]|nr:ABC transporter permease [Deltaproteobacteria bacterium]